MRLLMSYHLQLLNLLCSILSSTPVAALSSSIITHCTQQNSLAPSSTFARTPLNNHPLSAQQAHSILATTYHPPPPAHHYPHLQHYLSLPTNPPAHYPSSHASQLINYCTNHQSLYPTYTYHPPTAIASSHSGQYHTALRYNDPQPRASSSSMPYPSTSNFNHHNPAV